MRECCLTNHAIAVDVHLGRHFAAQVTLGRDVAPRLNGCTRLDHRVAITARPVPREAEIADFHCEISVQEEVLTAETD